jgi:hypothetical protein
MLDPRTSRRSRSAHPFTVAFLALVLAIGVSLVHPYGSQPSDAAAADEPGPVPYPTRQTMTGWEANAELGAGFCRGVDNYRAQVIDVAANQLGINRLRLEIRSGAENPVDHFAAQLAEGNGFLDEAKLKQNWYTTINDDDDPSSANPAGFQFSELDFGIDYVALPLKSALEARGEKLFVNLTYVDFGSSSFEHKDHPEEYAELIVATFQHMQEKYGFVPDVVGVSLEPENSNWSGSQLGHAIVAAGASLRAHGFSARFIAPSATNMDNALRYFDELSQVPGALQYLSEFSYHRYAGVSEANLRRISQRAERAGVKTSMLEHVGGTIEELHQDLKVGNASAWQQYALAGCGRDDGSMYIRVDETDPTNPKVALASTARLFSQYFRFVRLGAQRIDVATVTDTCDPVAFRNADGGIVLVMRSSGGSCSATGLPEGLYGVVYSTASEYDVRLADVAVGSPDETVTVTMPAAGVVTIHSRNIGEGCETPGDCDGPAPDRGRGRRGAGPAAAG